MKFRFGLEHEIALINSDGAFADFTNTAFSELEAVVEALPVYPSDYPQLRIGDPLTSRRVDFVRAISLLGRAHVWVNYKRLFDAIRVDVVIPPVVETLVNHRCRHVVTELRDAGHEVQEELGACGWRRGRFVEARSLTE